MSSTIDPTSMAQQLATAYLYDANNLVSTKLTAAQNTASALTELKSALSAFETAMSSLTTKKGVVSNSATLSDTDYGSATATGSAQPGTYSFFVEQLATTQQVSYSGLSSINTADGGTLTLSTAGGDSFSVSLDSTADTDSDGTLSVSEIARAINQASGNDDLAVASVITVNGTSTLVLSAGESGADAALTLDTSGLASSTLATALSSGNTLVAAQDAVVWLGDQTTGVRMQQSSNTFTSISGVTLTFTQAMATGDDPVTLTVATDTSGTEENLQSFIDAYNTLEGILDELTQHADESTDTEAGAFASDAGIRSLRSKLSSLLRSKVDGLGLSDYGVTIERDGTLSLDSDELADALEENPDGLNSLLGSTRMGSSSGLMGSLNDYLDLWTDSTSGQIASRQETVSAQQDRLEERQDYLDSQYEILYERYLKQFTQLQTLQESMSQTTSLFDSL